MAAIPEQSVATPYASFPWYDLSEMQPATDALWRALRESLTAQGIAALPAALERARPLGVDPEGVCLFTQTCGYLLFTSAREHFTVLGAPCYAVPGCAGPLHRSFIVVRERSSARTLEDLRGARFAINEPDSNSGMNLPRRLFAPLARDGRFFTSTVLSGSHAASAALVARGEAEAAAIDCVTFALLRRYRPAAVATLRTIAMTAATPAPPFVTARNSGPTVVAALRRGLREIVSEPRHATLREALFLADVETCGPEAYDVLLDYERDAKQLGYPVLA